MNIAQIQLEVEKAIDSFEKDIKFIGSSVTIEDDLLILDCEYIKLKFSFDIKDEGDCFAVTVTVHDEFDPNKLNEERGKIEIYINKLFYKIDLKP